MIHLILFKQNNEEKAKAIEDALAASFSQFSPLVLRSIPDLKARLVKTMPYKDAEIYVLIADTKDCLRKCFSLEKVLSDKRLILIIPDGKKSTLTLAHGLRPRFVFCSRDNPENLCAVISKMIQNFKSDPCVKDLKKRVKA